MGICISSPARRPGQQYTSCVPVQIHSEAILGIAAYAPHQQVLTSSEEGSIALCDLKSRKARWQVQQAHAKSVNRIASYQPDLVVSASRDTLVKTWRVGQQAPLHALQAHSLSITGLAALPEHGCICTGARDYAVKLWDVQTGQLLAEDAIQQNVVTHICRIAEEHSVLQARPALLACAGTLGTQPCLHTVQASEDLCLRVWDCRSMSVAQSLTGQSNIPLCCDCSPDGLYFAAACNGFDGDGCEVCIWDRRKQQVLARCQGHSQAATCCSFLPPALASQSEEQRQGSEQECRPVQQVPALPIASGSRDKTVRLWDGSDGSCLAVTEFQSDPHAAVTTLTHLPPSAGMLNDVLCAGNFDGQLQAWTCCRDPAGLQRRSPSQF